MALKTWTVTARDQFDRIFNYSQVENQMTIHLSVLPDIAYVYMFKKASREILKEMGEAAWAEWTCREDYFYWDE